MDLTLQNKLKEELCDFEWQKNEFNYLGMHFKKNIDHTITVDVAAYTNLILQKHLILLIYN